jgi:hypothetical protein
MSFFLIWSKRIGGIALAILIFASMEMESRNIRACQGSVRTVGDEVVYVARSSTLNLLTLGYKQVAADWIWLKTIQYFVRHLLTDRRYPWMIYFVNQIIEFDPQFKQLYMWAGSCILYGREITPERVFLSNRLYEEALIHFPEDYEPAYRLGMNFYSELRVDDPELRARYQKKGLAYFERAAHAPNAPLSVIDLIKGIAQRSGQDEILFYALTDEYLREQDPQLRFQLQKRLNSISNRLGQSASWQTRLQEIDRLDQIRQTEYPYLHSLDFELIYQPTPHPQSWRDLIPDLLK